MSAIAVKCPVCDADPGMPCRSHYLNGGSKMTNFHPARSTAGRNVVSKDEARHVLHFQWGADGGEHGGGFVQSLLLTIRAADQTNTNKLRQVYPGYVAALKDWTKQDLQDRLSEED